MLLFCSFWISWTLFCASFLLVVFDGGGEGEGGKWMIGSSFFFILVFVVFSEIYYDSIFLGLKMGLGGSSVFDTFFFGGLKTGS